MHQIIHLKRYRFFDIGTDHYYYDDFENERSITDIAEHSYIPALTSLLEMVKENKGFFKFTISLSGCGIEQMEMHAPKVLDLLKELADTGCVEFLAEPYSHGLASLANEECFAIEVKRQMKKMQEVFGQTPKVFRNSSLIYSNDIGRQVAAMGFKGMLTEGAKHVLGWKSSHYVYNCIEAPKLKLLLRDVELSDDISLRFNDSSWSEYPLYADRYIDKIAALPKEEQIVNIFMELSALGMAQPLSSNILDFFKAIPAAAKAKGITFANPTDIFSKVKAVDKLDVPDTLSWVDEERDVSCWLGNKMQREAFEKLYSLADRLMITRDEKLIQDWYYLQASNNFRFMTTKPNYVGFNRGIYDSPFDAFTNYMNILGDFINRVNTLYPPEIDNEELNGYITLIENMGKQIAIKDQEILHLHTTVEKLENKKKK